MYFVSQKFRPPKKHDDKSWEVAALMISNGFAYHTIRDNDGMPVPYPCTIDDAKRFIETYRSQTSEQNTRRKHAIEKQITELESREPNGQRAILVRKLKHELSKLTHDALQDATGG